MTPTPTPPYSEFLTRVEEQLRQALEEGADPREPTSQQLVLAASNLCLAPGAKRVRPWLVSAFGRAVGAPRRGLVDVAVAAELIHAGSLLHDDVVDDGHVRRGRPTANHTWGNPAAVLAGDLCLTQAFVQLRDHVPVLTAEAVEAIAAMTRAAMAEVERRGRLDVTAERWRAVAVGKTGALFAWCGRAAARLADRPEALPLFTACGHHLGVAFQLADDLADLLGGAGKERFSDLRNREPSYPLLLATQRSPLLRTQVERAWADEPVAAPEAERLGERVLASTASLETAQAIEGAVEAAAAALGPFGATPGGAEIVAWAPLLADRARLEGLHDATRRQACTS